MVLDASTEENGHAERADRHTDDTPGVSRSGRSAWRVESAGLLSPRRAAEAGQTVKDTRSCCCSCGGVSQIETFIPR